MLKNDKTLCSKCGQTLDKLGIILHGDYECDNINCEACGQMVECGHECRIVEAEVVKDAESKT